MSSSSVELEVFLFAHFVLFPIKRIVAGILLFSLHFHLFWTPCFFHTNLCFAISILDHHPRAVLGQEQAQEDGRRAAPLGARL
jgi:hypothetical protein